MSEPSRLSDLRGASRLAIDLTLRITDVVETMHHHIARPLRPRGATAPARAGGLTGFVYRRVRGMTRLVGNTLDLALAALTPASSETAAWAGRDAVLGALNGVLGDHLDASDNPLAIPMQLRMKGAPLPLAGEAIARVVRHPRPRVVLMVHGLCMTDTTWHRGAHDHGERLAHDLRADAIYLRYNSGRHVSTNGAAFANMLEALVAAWPGPLRELVLVGHSMGGLVVRSACACAEASGQHWPHLLRALVFLGTPHDGAPLERGGHGIDMLLRASPYTVAFTHVTHMRSAGITDLRHGSVLDADWAGRDRFARDGYRRHAQPLPGDVPAYAIGGTLSKGPGHGQRSDGLVPVASALGESSDAALRLAIPSSSQCIAYDTGHLELLRSTTVYERMKAWLTGRE